MDNQMPVLTGDLTLPRVKEFHPTEANHAYCHSPTQQGPAGSGAVSTLLGSLCRGTFGTETGFYQPGGFLSSVHAVSIRVAMPILQCMALDIRNRGVKWS